MQRDYGSARIHLILPGSVNQPPRTFSRLLWTDQRLHPISTHVMSHRSESPTGRVALLMEGVDPERFPNPIAVMASRLHGNVCLLCEKTEPIRACPVIVDRTYYEVRTQIYQSIQPPRQTTDGPFQNTIAWLQLCDSHAAQYKEQVWRFVPANVDDLSSKASIWFDSHSQTRPTGQPLPHESFDLVVFLPKEMEDLDAIFAKHASTCAQTEDAGSRRVLKNFKSIILQPFLAFAATLPMIGGAYVPPPDDHLLSLESACRQVRQQWNDSVQRGSSPGLCRGLEGISDFVRDLRLAKRSQNKPEE
ncbi:hypothetical protein BD310DRAFT_923338 [Dichomitus squalens]|uniref:Uncharacterized protein n=1 Tax=Dichomitus squalens TaxID=114155 RepID=A0A4Q9PZ82_9APHY|nr:hypothetical protein BD310DRAFT_923338 [Dichomitus squalens]